LQHRFWCLWSILNPHANWARRENSDHAFRPNDQEIKEQVGWSFTLSFVMKTPVFGTKIGRLCRVFWRLEDFIWNWVSKFLTNSVPRATAQQMAAKALCKVRWPPWV
jgi:hypothetical protein